MTATLNPHLYALVAGEISGDTLGAGLMLAIRRQDPQAVFIGIGGPRMCRLGLRSQARMSDLSVMGITEVARQLLPILKIRRQTARSILNSRPCVMVGIDSPDFNLTLERKVRAAGIPTVHYVSPSVWAWREGRMKKIRASCDLVLSLLEFEKKFYDAQHMPCVYVGHTLANAIPLDIDYEKCRERIDLYRNSVEKVGAHVMGILPGSRAGVIARMLPYYARAARLVKQHYPDAVFVSSVPTRELALLVKDVWLENSPDLSLTVYEGCTRDVIASCTAVLLTSGTVALETMLVNRPFCVAYNASSLTAAVGRSLLKTKIFSLPNLIAGTGKGEPIVNEFIQDDCTPEKLAGEMIRLLGSENLIIRQKFRSLHEQMRMNSDEIAARAVLALAGKALEAQRVREGSAAPHPHPEIFKNDIEPEVTLPDPRDVAKSGGKVEPGFGAPGQEAVQPQTRPDAESAAQSPFEAPAAADPAVSSEPRPDHPEEDAAAQGADSAAADAAEQADSGQEEKRAARDPKRPATLITRGDDR